MPTATMRKPAHEGAASPERMRVGAARVKPLLEGTHMEGESHSWTINIPDHVQRTESAAFRVARKVMNDIVDGLADFYLGNGPYQDHHGGGLWVKDHDGWFLIKNLAGMEWSQQFCADPAKVDRLRQFAVP